VKHPSESELALFAGGDLGFLSRWRLRKHLRQCNGCRSEVESYRQERETIRELADELPDGVNWARLSQEMTGNIRVGLAAGECVGPLRSRRPRSLAWHAMAVIAAAFVIVISAMWMNMPREQADHLFSSLKSIRWNRVGRLVPTVQAPSQDSVVLEASPASIELTANGGTMSFLTSRADNVAVSVSMQGSARTQYVDADTGQVTINKVHYAQ
jgi:hypothetical protein